VNDALKGFAVALFAGGREVRGGRYARQELIVSGDEAVCVFGPVDHPEWGEVNGVQIVNGSGDAVAPLASIDPVSMQGGDRLTLRFPFLHRLEIKEA
jgi:hypothetical protein